MAAENYCCPVTLLLIGSLLLNMARGNQTKIDKIQAGLVDALFIEGDDVNEDDCKRWGSSLSVTCEKSQAEKYKQGSADKTGAGGKPKGANLDIYLYSVTNAEDVIGGAKPRMIAIGPFEMKRQMTDRAVSDFTDGQVTYHFGSNYTFRNYPAPPPEELLAEEVVVPNAFYGTILAAGLEDVILSQAAGLFYRAEPDATWTDLQDGLQGAGDLDDAEIEQAWNGLIATTSQSEIGGTLETIATWPESKQTALLDHIATVAQAYATHAYGDVYGTGAALPMFVKMTAAEALNWRGAKKGEPIGGLSNIGFGQLNNKTLASRAKGGDTTIEIGPDAEDPKQSFRYVTMDKGVTQRCHFDPDCMAQQRFIDAGKGKGAMAECDEDEKCKPLKVGGFQASLTFPAPLFGDAVGTTEYGEGKSADLWASALARFTMRNTGPMIWHSTHDVLVDRWIIEQVHDRRENCDGADNDNAVGLDCSSPKGTWSLAPWYASTMPPPLYVGMIGHEAPKETMYRSNCPSENHTRRMECLDRGEKLEGSVVTTNFTQSKMWKEGPYDPLEKLVFLNPVQVDPLTFLDAEPNTGLIIRGSKAFQASMRLYPSRLFANVGDILIPLFVLHEHAAAGLGTRKTVKGLQGACKAELTTLPMLFGLGSIMVTTGILQCFWRLAPRKLDTPKEEPKEEQKGDVVLC